MGNRHTQIKPTPIPRPTVSYEIEAKVYLNKRITLPGKLEEDGVLTEHRFHYDSNDAYLFSTTDRRKIKFKDKATYVNVRGIDMLIRRERIEAMPSELPVSTSFRLVTRKRSSCHAMNCLIALDEITCGDATAIQLEVEYDGETDTFEKGLIGMQVVSEAMQCVLAHVYGTVEVTSLAEEKYEWAKRVSQPLPLFKERKGWLMKLFGTK